MIGVSGNIARAWNHSQSTDALLSIRRIVLLWRRKKMDGPRSRGRTVNLPLQGVIEVIRTILSASAPQQSGPPLACDGQLRRLPERAGRRHGQQRHDGLRRRKKRRAVKYRRTLGLRSASLAPQRKSMRTSWPSIQPNFSSPPRNAAMRALPSASSAAVLMIPPAPAPSPATPPRRRAA
jgi:hypothetical protein